MLLQARGARVAELERAVDERDRVVREQAEALVRAEERLQAATTLVEDRATAQRELREHLARLKEELQGSLEALLAAHAERTDGETPLRRRWRLWCLARVRRQTIPGWPRPPQLLPAAWRAPAPRHSAACLRTFQRSSCC